MADNVKMQGTYVGGKKKFSTMFVLTAITN